MTIAMLFWGYTLASYAIIIGGLASYAAWLIVRGRRLSKRVPAKDRRWM